jgi:hypothetical protein
LGEKAFAFLCAALSASLAHAAPNRIVTVKGLTLDTGAILDARHGYCVSQKIVIDEGKGGWIRAYDLRKRQGRGP